MFIILTVNLEYKSHIFAKNRIKVVFCVYMYYKSAKDMYMCNILCILQVIHEDMYMCNNLCILQVINWQMAVPSVL
jgi:hypothetical protein